MKKAGLYLYPLEDGVREIVIQPLSPDLDDYYVELDNPFPETFSKSTRLPSVLIPECWN